MNTRGGDVKQTNIRLGIERDREKVEKLYFSVLRLRNHLIWFGGSFVIVAEWMKPRGDFLILFFEFK